MGMVHNLKRGLLLVDRYYVIYLTIFGSRIHTVTPFFTVTVFSAWVILLFHHDQFGLTFTKWSRALQLDYFSPFVKPCVLRLSNSYDAGIPNTITKAKQN